MFKLIKFVEFTTSHGGKGGLRSARGTSGGGQVQNFVERKQHSGASGVSATMDFFVPGGVEISIQHHHRPSIRLKDEE
jgi:hypothetical protein